MGLSLCCLVAETPILVKDLLFAVKVDYAEKREKMAPMRAELLRVCMHPRNLDRLQSWGLMN
jgi:hypothetical protein